MKKDITITGRFFVVNNDYEKIYLEDTNLGNPLVEYKKLLIIENKDDDTYIEVFQPLNVKGENTKWFYIDEDGEHTECTELTKTYNRNQDLSAINYCVETYCFNKWLDNKSITRDDVLTNKNEKIIENIQNNLKLSLANYSANSKIDYKLPILTDKDWEQALSNISMITFFQGMKSGLKIYNNYAVATSEENNEYVNEDSLYFIGERDEYYHNFGCDTEEQVNEAYRNTEFNINSYISEGQTNYYYKHVFYDEGNTAIRKCFNCIVNRNLLNISANTIPLDLKYRALAREKYIQMGRTKLIN